MKIAGYTALALAFFFVSGAATHAGRYYAKKAMPDVVNICIYDSTTGKREDCSVLEFD